MIELREHQTKAVSEMHNGCILWGGVGTGKTIASLAYYVAKEAPKPVYVITTAKKRNEKDWEKEAMYFGIGVKESLDGLGTVTVDSWHNIKKYVDIEGAFFIFDEQHASGGGVWAKSFIKIARKNRWVLLSATPGDTWIEYIPVMVARGYYKNITDFKNQHTIYTNFGGFPQLKGYMNEAKLYRIRDEIRVEMTVDRHTTRHIKRVPVDYDRTLFKSVIRSRQDPITEEPFVNAAAFVHGLRMIGNRDPSRIEAVNDLVVNQHIPRAIIFYNFDYELEMLREWGAGIEGLNVYEYNGHKHDPVPTSGRWVYLVQYNGAEAWNCVQTDTIIFYSLTYSHKIFEQAQGRTDRMNTPYSDLYYYVLMNNGPIDLKIWKTLKEKKNFNERTLYRWFE